MKPCKKKRLLELIKQYQKQVGRYWYMSVANRKNLELFSEHHRKILEAFKSRDSGLVRISVENHIESYGNTATESLRVFEPIEFERNVPRKPHLVGGVKGPNIK